MANRDPIFLAGGPHTSATASATQKKHFVWGLQQSLGHHLSRADFFRVGPLRQVGTHENCHNQHKLLWRGPFAWRFPTAPAGSSKAFGKLVGLASGLP